MSSGRSLVTVDSNRLSLTQGLNAFVDALNPLGAIAKTVAEIMACRIEIERIRQESETIRLEYQSRNRAIDATLQIALNALENRRVAMERFFQHAERQMRQHHIYGNQIVRTIQNMNKLITKRGISLEEKQLAHETIRSLSRELVVTQQAGAKTLAVLVETTRQDLLAVPPLKGLLPPGG
jgi:hypothetical protein